MHDEDPLAQQQRLFELVRDQYDGARELLLDGQQLRLQLAAGQKIERGERLVHQKQLRLAGKDARKAEPLLHAGRKLHGREVGIVLQPDQTDEVRGLFIPLLRRLADAAGHGDVALHVRPGDDIGVGAQHGAVPALRDADLAGVRLFLPGQQLQKGALAAAAAADDDRELPGGERHREVLQHLPRAALPLLAGDDDLRTVGCISLVHMPQGHRVHKYASVRSDFLLFYQIWRLNSSFFFRFRFLHSPRRERMIVAQKNDRQEGIFL